MLLKLSKPVRLGDHEYTELSLREPTVGENEQALKAGDGVAPNIRLLSLVASIPEAAVRQMSRGDFLRAIDFFEQSTATIRGSGHESTS